MSLFYLFTVMFDFARWSILDSAGSECRCRFSKLLVTCILVVLSLVFSGLELAGDCLWYILDWNFRDARGVYNGRLCGRSFSVTSGKIVAVRRVRVFVLVDLHKPNLCVWGGLI